MVVIKHDILNELIFNFLGFKVIASSKLIAVELNDGYFYTVKARYNFSPTKKFFTKKEFEEHLKLYGGNKWLQI